MTATHPRFHDQTKPWPLQRVGSGIKTFAEKTIKLVVPIINRLITPQEKTDERGVALIIQDQTDLLKKCLNGVASSVEAYEAEWSDDGNSFCTKFLVEVAYNFHDSDTDYDS